MPDSVQIPAPRPPWPYLLAGAALCVGVLVASFWIGRSALLAWQTAFLVAASIPIGGLCLRMVMQLAPGFWHDELTVQTEAAIMLLPLAAVLFLPIPIGMPLLYDWIANPPEKSFPAIFLSWPVFLLISVAWFGCLLLLGTLLLRRRHCTRVSVIGIIGFVLVDTFVAALWVMSFDPGFESSGFGLYFISVQICIAFMAAGIAALRGGAGLRRPGVIGSLMLTIILLWAYLAFMQYFIIWSGNLPAGVSWYEARAGGGWNLVLWAIAALHAIPAFLLLLKPVRDCVAALLAFAVLVLIGKTIEMLWLILPAGTDVMSSSILTLCAAAGMGLLFTGAYEWTFAWRVFVRAPKRAGRRYHD